MPPLNENIPVAVDDLQLGDSLSIRFSNGYTYAVPLTVIKDRYEKDFPTHSAEDIGERTLIDVAETMNWYDLAPHAKLVSVPSEAFSFANDWNTGGVMLDVHFVGTKEDDHE